MKLEPPMCRMKFCFAFSSICVAILMQYISGNEFRCLHDQDVLCEQCPRGYDPYPECDQCVDSRLDPSSNCTLCELGENKCHTANFTLSVLFHSYLNLKHLCGECREKEFGPVCCDTLNETENCPSNCEVRIVLSVEAYETPPILDVEFPRLSPDFHTDNITLFKEGPNVFNNSMISNPYILQLDTWTERFQFYIVVYDFYRVMSYDEPLLRQHAAVDRFLINVNLGPPPANLSRRMYTGIHNLSLIDLSFSIRCSNNFCGADCNLSCIPNPCLHNCDDMGRIGSTLEPTTLQLTEQKGNLGAILGGVVGGLIIAAVLIVLSLLCICIPRSTSKTNADAYELELHQNANGAHGSSSSKNNDNSEGQVEVIRNQDCKIADNEDETSDNYEYIFCKPTHTKSIGKQLVESGPTYYSEPTHGEPMTSSVPSESGPTYSDPTHGEPRTRIPSESGPTYSNPTHGEPMTSRVPPESGPTYNEPTHGEPMTSRVPPESGPTYSNPTHRELMTSRVPPESGPTYSEPTHGEFMARILPQSGPTCSKTTHRESDDIEHIYY